MVTATSTPTTEIYGQLIELDRQMEREGVSRHDRVTVLIEACILNGVDSGKLIVHVLSMLQFNKRQVGKMLDEQSGATSALGRWFRNAEGRYELHDPMNV